KTQKNASSTVWFSRTAARRPPTWLRTARRCAARLRSRRLHRLKRFRSFPRLGSRGYGVQALACTDLCRLKADLHTCSLTKLRVELQGKLDLPLALEARYLAERGARHITDRRP